MKEIHDFTSRYDLDFFMRKLLGFLVTNKFILDPDTHQVVQNVIDAENAFYEQRLAGKLVPEALEIAEDTLFQNVGLSQYDIVTEILMENYSDNFELDSEQAMEYWTIRALTEIPDLFEEFDASVIGIDRHELDTNYNAVVGRIVNFMSDNGIQ